MMKWSFTTDKFCLVPKASHRKRQITCNVFVGDVQGTFTMKRLLGSSGSLQDIMNVHTMAGSNLITGYTTGCRVRGVQ